MLYLMPNLPTTYTAPVIIGGVGGSGTRLIAQCLRELGFFMGSDLNRANDNHWFTLLFKRKELAGLPIESFAPLIEIFWQAMSGAGQFSSEQVALVHELAAHDRGELHPSSGLKPIAHSLLSVNHQLAPNRRWGWKEPNSYLFIEALNHAFPKMKYIHVVRNGLDMAYSRNQNQLKLWGDFFLGEPIQVTPYYSLRYWCSIHQWIIEQCRPMGTNFLFLSYDHFCLNPSAGIQQLADFLELAITNQQALNLAKLIQIPESFGRFKQHDLSIFDKADIAFVEQLEFDIA